MSASCGDVNQIQLEVLGSDELIVLDDFRAVIAGYTGSDPYAVQAHIAELAAIGVAPPEAVPAFYSVPKELISQSYECLVSSPNTTGEVEPVLVRYRGRFYLTVGSDHTDRDLERVSVAASKVACPKPIARRAIALNSGGIPCWAQMRVSSTVDLELYQEGTLAALLNVGDVAESYLASFGDDGRDLVLFGGTIALRDGVFRLGRQWTVMLSAELGTIAHTYEVVVREDGYEAGN